MLWIRPLCQANSKQHSSTGCLQGQQGVPFNMGALALTPRTQLSPSCMHIPCMPPVHASQPCTLPACPSCPVPGQGSTTADALFLAYRGTDGKSLEPEVYPRPNGQARGWLLRCAARAGQLSSMKHALAGGMLPPAMRCSQGCLLVRQHARPGPRLPQLDPSLPHAPHAARCTSVG